MSSPPHSIAFTLGDFDLHLIIDQAAPGSAPVLTLTGVSRSWELLLQGTCEPVAPRATAAAPQREVVAAGHLRAAAAAVVRVSGYEAGRAAHRAIAAAAPARIAGRFDWLAPIATVLEDLVHERRWPEDRLRKSFALGRSDCLVVHEKRCSRAAVQEESALDGRSASFYAVLYAPQQEIHDLFWTSEAAVFRAAVGPAGEVPEARGKIRFSPDAVGRGFWTVGEVRAYLAGAGRDSLPDRR